jgi:hypothetical protein
LLFVRLFGFHLIQEYFSVRKTGPVQIFFIVDLLRCFWFSRVWFSVMADLTALPMIGSLMQPMPDKSYCLVEFFPFLGDWIVPDGKAMLTS